MRHCLYPSYSGIIQKHPGEYYIVKSTSLYLKEEKNTHTEH